MMRLRFVGWPREEEEEEEEEEKEDMCICRKERK